MATDLTTIGTRVQLVSLNAAAYNGKCGTVVAVRDEAVWASGLTAQAPSLRSSRATLSRRHSASATLRSPCSFCTPPSFAKQAR